ncbi:MAG: AAA family ATPase, partial [Halanaeroarchaeum sp.]
MRVVVTGTPGTGKTSATEVLESDLDVVHLNEAIREEELFGDVDEERDSVIADLDAIREWIGDRDD